MRDVFISHIEADSYVALNIALGLEKSGYSTWCYEIDNSINENYIEQSAEEIDNSKSVLVIISPQSIRSAAIHKEAHLAYKKDKAIIPILLDILDIEYDYLKKSSWNVLFYTFNSHIIPQGDINNSEGILSNTINRIVQELSSRDIQPNKEIDVEKITRINIKLSEVASREKTERIRDLCSKALALINSLIYPVIVLLELVMYETQNALLMAEGSLHLALSSVNQVFTAESFFLRTRYSLAYVGVNQTIVQDQLPQLQYRSKEKTGMVGNTLDADQQNATPEVPSGRVDLVHFSVTSPQVVKPDSSFIVGISAHLGKQRKEVIRREQEASPEGDVTFTTEGPEEVKRGTVLTVRLKIDELEIEPAEVTILWAGEIGKGTFSVRVPKDAKKGKRVGAATIYKDGFQIAIIHFEISIGNKSSNTKQIKAKVKRHQTAFAAYAHDDKVEVLTLIQGIQKGSPDLDIFVDVDKLRASQYWEREIRNAISERDVLYLFWSESAKKSDHVEYEWRYALKKRGLRFIDPCPLVSPDDVPPPKELIKLHFEDRWRIYREKKKN